MKKSIPGSVALSVAVLAVATLVFGRALARALTLDGPPAVAAENGDAQSAPKPSPSAEKPAPPPARTNARVPSERALPTNALRLAVDNDPFQPDRRRAEPYRLPSEMPREQPKQPELPPPPPFRVLGIVEMGEGNGNALIQVNNATPQVLAVGESMLGYILDHVEGTTATMVRDGQSVSLTVADASERPSRGRNGRGRNAGPQDAQQQMMDRLKETGLPDQVIENMMQRLQGRFGGRGNRGGGGSDTGGGGGGSTTGRQGNSRVPLRPRPDTLSAPQPRAPNEP